MYTRPSVRPRIAAEAGEFMQSSSAAILEIWPEVNYFSFALLAPPTIKMIIEEATHATGSFLLPDLGEPAGISWNAMDAACSLGTGLMQLHAVANQKEHRRVATGTKGLVNIGVSVQLSVLTALGATLSGNVGIVAASALGPIGFATAFGAGFVLSLDDLARSCRRQWSFEYWLKDSLAEMAIKEKMVEDLKAEIDQIPQEQFSGMARWAIIQKKSRLAELARELEILQENIEARVRYRKDDEKLTSSSRDIISKARAENPNSKIWSRLANNQSVKDYKNREQSIIKATRLDTFEKYCNSVIWALAFTGMLLACIPGCQPAAAIVITVASSLYILKNSKKVIDMASNYYEDRKLLKSLQKLYDEIETLAKELKGIDPKNQVRIGEIQREALALKRNISYFSILNPSPGLAKKIKRLQEKIAVTNDRIQSFGEAEINKFDADSRQSSYRRL